MARSKEKSPAFVVDPQDEPSAEWGWHGTFPRATRVAGWITAIVCFLFLIGNHRGNVENLWLIFTGAGLIVLLIIDQVRRRTSWRR
ncbi:uncharacterized protein DUF2631 [Herbihabitans rhizosphaerae]|uniref:Uncharacterized protein DUF2631 n=1 Tax=Herbihabitans rhizosphaerae TaxID=1872711 RepID=A0A4Q7KIG2_9PSEU|nr:DUF2631 domain-containing protein [Herbihabitans rhizosphaerae]RZS34708.1 uncharacterized protein DUF2631 [Herbihabitans rhizosphaerae]